jgi:hypothetical protein
VLLKILLFSGYPSLFNLKCLAVLQLDFCLFKLHLFDHFVKVVIDLTDHFDFALLDFVLKLGALFLEVFRVKGKVTQVLDNYVSVFLQNIDCKNGKN